MDSISISVYYLLHNIYISIIIVGSLPFLASALVLVGVLDAMEMSVKRTGLWMSMRCQPALLEHDEDNSHMASDNVVSH